ncbi:MAG: GNAT family N-acetyltransferase [Pseudonocardiales bacterium]|nr:GNAT family N-acetyltransferase [Actinomycetota bacterium]PZS21607.1 MAG: GNAT family N-acetyltransferase [Pseudonocardiales bacterium]
MSINGRLQATLLSSCRLLLQPVRIDHAEDMVAILRDPDLYSFIGGGPPSVIELRSRYTRQVVGQSEDGSEWWLNWVVRRRDNLGAVGYVQATVTREPGGCQAEVAWVIGTRHQYQGFAQEAAALMAGWLRQHGVSTIVAHVHPDHYASAVVARSIGLTPTKRIEDGEVRWQG